MSLNLVIERSCSVRREPFSSARELVSAIRGAGDTDELMPNEFARVKESEWRPRAALTIEYVEQIGVSTRGKSDGWQLVSAGTHRGSQCSASNRRGLSTLLETLAIVATVSHPRAYVEAVRVRGDGVLQSLWSGGRQDRRLAEVPGRPLSRTTQFFSNTLVARRDELQRGGAGPGPCR